MKKKKRKKEQIINLGWLSYKLNRQLTLQEWGICKQKKLQYLDASEPVSGHQKNGADEK